MSFVPAKGQFYRLVAKQHGGALQQQSGMRLSALFPGSWTGHEHQQFHFHLNGQFYNIVIRSDGRSLDVPSESKEDGVRLILWDRHDHSLNQQFQFLPAGGGAYYISPRHSQKFLCIDQNLLTQHVWNGGEHFKFLFTPCLPFTDLQVLRHAVFWRMGLLRDFVMSLPSDKSRQQHGVKYLASLIWSPVDGNLLNQLQDYLRDTAGQLFDGESIKALEASMPDIERAVEHYAWTPGPAEELGMRLTTLLERLQSAQARYLDHTAPEKALPYLLVLGTLHLAALRERYDDFENLYPWSPVQREQLLDELRGHLKQYAHGSTHAQGRASHWRLGFIELTQERLHQEQWGFVITDRYNGYREVVSTDRRSEDVERAIAALEAYRRHVTERFNAEWSVLFGPASVWRRMDPIERYQPRIAYAASVSAVFGGRRGTTFDGENDTAQTAPIREIQIKLNDAEDRVLGLRIMRTAPHGTRTWGAFHQRGVLRKHLFTDEECITAAYGDHRGYDESLYSLYFVTNKGHIVGGGRRDRGKAWASEAPTGVAPKLGTVTCWASDGEIEGIAFTWMYGREV